MATATTHKHKFTNYLWDDDKLEQLTPAQRLVYRSNLLGSDQRITNTGGGNTSAKLIELDPISGEPRSEEHTSELQSRQYLHSFPTRRSSDLVYRSNLLGSDQRITNTGGGNTSAKLIELDPISGEP